MGSIPPDKPPDPPKRRRKTPLELMAAQMIEHDQKRERREIEEHKKQLEALDQKLKEVARVPTAAEAWEQMYEAEEEEASTARPAVVPTLAPSKPPTIKPRRTLAEQLRDIEATKALDKKNLAHACGGISERNLRRMMNQNHVPPEQALRRIARSLQQHLHVTLDLAAYGVTDLAG